MTIFFNGVTSVDDIASVDNMKRLQFTYTYCVKLNYIIIQVYRAKGGLHTFFKSAYILILSSPSGLLTGIIY